MKKVTVLNGIVDVVEFNTQAPESSEHPFVVSDDTEVFGGWTSNGDGTFTAPAAPDPTNEHVNDERARRKGLGAPVNITGIGEFTMDTRPNTDDMINITGLTLKGTLLVSLADTLTTIPVRDSDNVERDLTGAQLVQLGEQVAAHHSVLYQCSWNLKDLSTIPTDYATNDDYWSLSYWEEE